ncbi:MAG: MinD/ParA family protein [Mariprofundaceae bacterium]
MNQSAIQSQSSPQVIAVASGKGGVGKTFFSLQLAARSAQQGKRVLLMDADLGLANADVMLGISAPCAIHQVLEGHAHLKDIIVDSGHDFDVLPGGSGLHGLTALAAHQQQLILDEMAAIGSDYDIVIIDTAAGIGDNVLYFVSAAESALVVLSPDPTSLTDAYALIKVLSQQRDMDHFMVVVNQADEVEAQIVFRRLLSVADRYLNVNLNYMGFLPHTHSVRNSIQAQAPFSQDFPPSLDAALDAVLQQPRDISRSSGLRFFWQHSLHNALNDDQNTASSSPEKRQQNGIRS